MASSAAASGSSSKAARKARARRTRPSAAARARQAAAGAPTAAVAAAPAGWVGVRQRLWGGYAAEIRIPSSRKRVWIGRFEQAVQAAVAYDAAMFLFYGKVLPKLRRYNFPGAPRPAVSEFIRRALTVANVKTIAEDHARRFGRFFAPLPHTPPGVTPVPSAAPPAAPAAPLPVAASGGAAPAAGARVAGGAAAAGAGVAGGATVDGAGVAVGASATAAGAGATTTTADDEVYIDADILTAADLQFTGNPVPDEDFVRLMDMDMDMDLIFGEI